MKKTLLVLFVLLIINSAFTDHKANLKKWQGKFERNKNKVLNGGKVIFEDNFDKDPLKNGWLQELGTWKWEKGSITGDVPDSQKKPDSMLWTKQKFKGSLAVDFVAETYDEKFSDINLMLVGRAPNYIKGKPECRCYLFGVGGWGNTQAGVERAPDYKFKSLTQFSIKPKTKYKITCARIKDKLYMFVDDKMIIFARDQNMLPMDREGPISFHIFRSKIKFHSIRVRQL